MVQENQTQKAPWPTSNPYLNYFLGLVVFILILALIWWVYIRDTSDTIIPAVSGPFSLLGCYADKEDRALIPRENTGLFPENYSVRENPIEKCFEVAKKNNDKYFALQDGGWCSSVNDDSYKKYGVSSACVGGEGGAYANDVYVIN